jgi:conjugal transfer pilus assembly protein TraE
MNFKLQQHRLMDLKERLSLLRVLLVSLMFSNLALVVAIIFIELNQRVEITPFFGGNPYDNSMLAVDPNYLKMMGENFIFLRFNTTPESVSTHHKQLLSMVAYESYASFTSALDAEARIISHQKISSHFDIQQMHLDPHHLECRIQGVLHRSVGLRELKDERSTYFLKFKYHLGRLQLQRFVKEKDNEH